MFHDRYNEITLIYVTLQDHKLCYSFGLQRTDSSDETDACRRPIDLVIGALTILNKVSFPLILVAISRLRSLKSPLKLNLVTKD